MTLATAVPAFAAEPSTVDQDVNQLYQDVSDLYAGIPADAVKGIDPLIDSPVDQFGTKAHAQQGPIPGCTEGALLQYADKAIAALTPTESKALGAMEGLSELYAAAVATDKTPQVFGSSGQYTPRANAVIEKLRGFWDIESWNIPLLAWKGTDLGDQDKTAQTFGLAFDPAKAKEAAALTSKVLYEVPVLQGGRMPLLTLNAFSAPAGSIGGKRVVLGDGILDVTKTLGFDDVSVEAVLGHEYGHQLDFAHNNFPGNESGEMGPDAYGGYFVAHAKGEAFDARTQQEVTYLNASIGDCFHSHGTPDQRRAAGAWGEQHATRQANPNKIIPSAQMVTDFQKEYPKLVPSGDQSQLAAAHS
ncbi:MAG TPA: M48 family metalloprotease [Amycolatopsis sp.]|nr:M48 family metalloprotease [Amycolatopsis sp.]